MLSLLPPCKNKTREIMVESPVTIDHLHLCFFSPLSGWSRGRQRKLHASSKQRCSLRKSRGGQRDRQPVLKAGQETQSEEEEMSQDPAKPTDSYFPVVGAEISPGAPQSGAAACCVSRDQSCCSLRHAGCRLLNSGSTVTSSSVSTHSFWNVCVVSLEHQSVIYKIIHNLFCE